MKPLMVMAVGNTVEGDSRVEKMAVSARDQGYEVVIVGMKQRDVSMLGSYERIPIYRLVPDWSQYLEWRRRQPKEEMGAEDYIDQENERIRNEVANLKSKTEEKVGFVLSIRNLPRLVAPSRFSQRLEKNVDVNEKLAPVFQKVIDARESWVRAKLNKQNLGQWLRSGQPLNSGLKSADLKSCSFARSGNYNQTSSMCTIDTQCRLRSYTRMSG